MATSSGPRGSCPSRIPSGANGFGIHVAAMVGAPPVETTLPSLPTIAATSLIWPATWLTSGSCRILSSS